jgi:hypothetical protein
VGGELLEEPQLIMTADRRITGRTSVENPAKMTPPVQADVGFAQRISRCIHTLCPAFHPSVICFIF